MRWVKDVDMSYQRWYLARESESLAEVYWRELNGERVVVLQKVGGESWKVKFQGETKDTTIDDVQRMFAHPDRTMMEHVL